MTHLTFECDCPQTLELSKRLHYLSFDGRHDARVVLPKHLRKLRIEEHNNFSIVLNSNLSILHLGAKYKKNCILNNIPKVHIIIGSSRSYFWDNLPNGTRKISFDLHFNKKFFSIINNLPSDSDCS